MGKDIKITNEITKSFGKRLREIRESQGISQELLAEKAGVHRTYIGMLERGERNITLTSMTKLSKGLNVNINELLKDL